MNSLEKRLRICEQALSLSVDLADGDAQLLAISDTAGYSEQDAERWMRALLRDLEAVFYWKQQYAAAAVALADAGGKFQTVKPLNESKALKNALTTLAHHLAGEQEERQ